MATAAVGCATRAPMRIYPGPELPAEQVARLSGSAHHNVWIVYNRTTYIHVVSVDDHVSVEPTDEWIMLPGAHTVETMYQVRRFIAGPYGGWASIRHNARRSTIAFVAQAGRRYRVDGEEVIGPNGIKEYRPWVEDVETGEVVSREEIVTAEPADGKPEPDTVEDPSE